MAELDVSSSQTGIFCCNLCGFKFPYDYKGDKPPFFKKDVELLEVAYVIRDPFADTDVGGIILGSDCSICRVNVCVSQGCSSFNTKRICRQCGEKNKLID